MYILAFVLLMCEPIAAACLF